MTEIERIADQLKRAYEGNAWHGPAVAEILSGVSATVAAARPIPGRHSIWELLGHIATDHRIVRRRIVENSGVDPTPEENFPKVTDESEAAWKRAMADADRAYRELQATILELSDGQLASKVPAHDYPVYVMLHGAVQHTLYHAGQMALLRPPPPRA